MTRVKLLDCTLRDGSYQVDFNFSRLQTETLCRGLSNSGIDMIEVGHGLGIGASQSFKPALETDINYAEAAEKGAPNKWGMFAIPSIATPEAVKRIFESGMGFLRIGIDVDATSDGFRFVTKVQRLCPTLRIYVNFMKSYAKPAEDFAEIARIASGLGVQGIYLVDSAGGMTPQQILKYGSALLEKDLGVELGFHGHDNLGLSVANSLSLAKLGFNLIDGTLRGLGRSAGNAPLERLVALFIREELLDDNASTLEDLLILSEEFIMPIRHLHSIHGLDTLAGFCEFHSSYMDALLREAAEFSVSPYKLMRSVVEVSKIAAPKELLTSLAARIDSDNSKLQDFPLTTSKYSDLDSKL